MLLCCLPQGPCLHRVVHVLDPGSLHPNPCSPAAPHTSTPPHLTLLTPHTPALPLLT